ncbi:NAD(P)-binding protein [Aulographum hederae CBS 113979]|uniref:NAD(P)-binding protein n=1 Tax=Aulographum hederae CBS 113979 TaxID=1176131 RepID=A0A6G1HGW1_9PEZI|nr:NAD(P)-binding protein [Aulographum hederae CBS 113979]
MSTDIKNIMIVGASGNLGSVALPEILKTTKLNVSVLTRPESTAKFPPNVNVVRSAYTPEAFKGQDAVICLLGFTGFADQQKVVDATIAAGVKWYFPSEFGCDTADPRTTEIVPVLAAKAQIAEYLRTKEKEISWTGVITGPFFDWGLKNNFLLIDAKAKTATVWDSGDTPFTTTNLATIGTALRNICESPSLLEEAKNKYVYIESYTISQNELIAVFEKVVGAKFGKTYKKNEDVIKEAHELLKEGNFMGGVPLLLQVTNFSDLNLGNFKSKLWNDKVLKDVHEDLEEDVKKVIASQA